MNYQEIRARIEAGRPYFSLQLTGPEATGRFSEPAETERLAVLEGYAFPSKVWLKDLNASAQWGAGKYIKGYERGFIIYGDKPGQLFIGGFDFTGAHQTPWPDMPMIMHGRQPGELVPLSGAKEETIPLFRCYNPDSLPPKALELAGVLE